MGEETTEQHLDRMLAVLGRAADQAMSAAFHGASAAAALDRPALAESLRTIAGTAGDLRHRVHDERTALRTARGRPGLPALDDLDPPT